MCGVCGGMIGREREDFWSIVVFPTNRTACVGGAKGAERALIKAQSFCMGSADHLHRCCSSREVEERTDSNRNLIGGSLFSVCVCVILSGTALSHTLDEQKHHSGKISRQIAATTKTTV